MSSPATNLEASLADYYAERAPGYERIYHKPERQQDLSGLRERIGCIFSGANVLELACGTGYWTAVLAGSAKSVLALDLNDEVLAIARAKSIDPQKVRFFRGDAYALPETTEPFDAGLAVFWWSHVPKARLSAFLEGFHRKIRPGGRVVFIDNAFVAGSSTPLSRADTEGNTYQVRRLDDGRSYEVQKNFPAEHELRAAVEGEATDLSIEFLQYYWILSYRLKSGDESLGPQSSE